MITVTFDITRTGTHHFKHVLEFDSVSSTSPRTSKYCRKTRHGCEDLGSYHWSNFSKAEQQQILEKLAICYEARCDEWVATTSRTYPTGTPFTTWIFGERVGDDVANTRLLVWAMNPVSEGWRWDAGIRGGGIAPTREQAMLAAMRASKKHG